MVSKLESSVPGARFLCLRSDNLPWRHTAGRFPSSTFFPSLHPPSSRSKQRLLDFPHGKSRICITLNLEELLSGTSWLRTIRSKSVPGLSSIFLIFEPGTDIMRARQLVQERLMFAYALPNVSKTPVMLNPLSATSRAMMIGVSSKELSLIDLSVLVRFTIKPKLMGVPA